MGLTPSLKSVRDLLKKLEREAYRAYHSHDDIDKFDHFYNFCVSAHSMRDFFFEDKSIVTVEDRKPYHDEWKNDEILRAVGEIANSSKHLVLREWNGTQKEVKTHGVSTRTNTFVDLYICNEALEKEFVRRREVSVALGDDYEVALYDFTSRVLHRWYRILESHHMINDDPQLLCRLGGMYNNEWEHVPKDHIKAVKYLCRAAERDNRDAMAGLGVKFYMGDGVLEGV